MKKRLVSSSGTQIYSKLYVATKGPLDMNIAADFSWLPRRFFPFVTGENREPV